MALYIGEQMILAEWLFVETIDDLRHRSADPPHRTRYELLGIAPLLRKLLIDSAPLVNTVRSARPEIPVGFRIRPWREFKDELGSEDLERYFGIGDERIVGAPGTQALGLKGFLKTVIGVAEGDELTVKSVIRYYSHIEGGVHFGAPKEAGESTISSMSPILLGHSTGQIQILAHLGRIAADALEPLRSSILATPSIHSNWHIKDERGLYMNHWTTEYVERLSQRPTAGGAHRTNRNAI